MQSEKPIPPHDPEKNPIENKEEPVNADEKKEPTEKPIIEVEKKPFDQAIWL